MNRKQVKVGEGEKSIQIAQPENYRKYTFDQVADALRENRGLYAPTALALGASRATIQAYVRESPELQAIAAQAKETQIDRAESKLFEAIERNEAWAIAFYLKTQAKSRGYIERSERINISVDIQLLQRWESALQAANLNPGDVIEAMIEEVSNRALPAGDENTPDTEQE